MDPTRIIHSILELDKIWKESVLRDHQPVEELATGYDFQSVDYTDCIKNYWAMTGVNVVCHLCRLRPGFQLTDGYSVSGQRIGFLQSGSVVGCRSQSFGRV